MIRIYEAAGGDIVVASRGVEYFVRTLIHDVNDISFVIVDPYYNLPSDYNYKTLSRAIASAVDAVIRDDEEALK